jgi:hypothetical protein
MMGDDACGAVGGMRIGKGKRSSGEILPPVLFCLPQVPHDLAWDRTRATAVGCRQLTA